MHSGIVMSVCGAQSRAANITQRNREILQSITFELSDHGITRIFRAKLKLGESILGRGTAGIKAQIIEEPAPPGK